MRTRPARVRGRRTERSATGHHGVHALLRVRSRLFITYRLTVRLGQAIATDGGARTGPWRLLLVAFVLLDVATWWVLRDPARYALKTRLVVDSLDMAVWSVAPYPSPDRYAWGVFIGSPLAIEAGLRTPLAAVVVPLAGFTATSAARAALGRAFVPLPMLWLVLATSCGVLLSRYDRRLRRLAAQEWRRRRAAEDRRSYLAGQNAVAMGASSVVDAIEGLVPILGRPPAGSPLWQLSDGWKSGLGNATRTEGAILEAAYLADELRQWEREHNRHPDLSTHVVLTPAEGIGTLLLTGTQIPALWASLDALALKGAYRVDVDEQPGSHQAGRGLRLSIGDVTVVVAPDAKKPSRPYDLGPISFVAIALLSLGDVTQMDIPIAAASGCIAVFLLAARWSDQQIRRYGRMARDRIVRVAAAAGALMTVVFSGTARRTVNPSGAGLYAVIPTLDLLAILVGGYRSTLRRQTLLLAAACAGFVVTAAWIFHTGGHHANDLILTLCWPACALVTSWKFGPALEDAITMHRRDFERNDAAADAIAFRRGATDVVDLVRQARDQAQEELASLQWRLSPEMYATATRRLQQVDERLTKLGAGAGSSSSTTTS